MKTTLSRTTKKRLFKIKRKKLFFFGVAFFKGHNTFCLREKTHTCERERACARFCVCREEELEEDSRDAARNRRRQRRRNKNRHRRRDKRRL